LTWREAGTTIDGVAIRTLAAGILFLSAFVACGDGVAPRPSVDAALTWACPILPIAREVRTNLSLTLDAARRGDIPTAALASRAAADGSARIGTALQALNPRPSPDAVVAYLLSLNVSGQQIAVLFTADAPSTPRNLASLEQVLALLDESLAASQPELIRSGLANC
jgi:hypothetical protein